MSKSKKTKQPSAPDVLRAALDVLREFVCDVELPYGGDGPVDQSELTDTWPDLVETYKRAKAVLVQQAPAPFDERRYNDPQGVIDDLIALTTRQAVDIHNLLAMLKSAEAESEPALEPSSESPKLFT